MRNHPRLLFSSTFFPSENFDFLEPTGAIMAVCVHCSAPTTTEPPLDTIHTHTHHWIWLGPSKHGARGGCGLSQLMPHQRTPYDIFLGLGAPGHGTHPPPPLPTNLTRKPCTSLKSRVIVSVICVAFFSSHALFIPSPFTLYPLSLRLTLSVLPPSLFNTHFLPLPTSPFITHFLLFDHSDSFALFYF